MPDRYGVHSQIFVAGEAYHFDWTYEHVELASVEEAVKVAMCGCATGARSTWWPTSIVLDELGNLPFSQHGGALLFHLIRKLLRRVSVIVTAQLTGAPDLLLRPDHPRM